MLIGQSVRVPCRQSGCGCKAFAWIPSRPEDVGEYWLPKRRNFDPAAWRLNCRCKHNHEEHDVGGQHRCLSVSFFGVELMNDNVEILHYCHYYYYYDNDDHHHHHHYSTTTFRFCSVPSFIFIDDNFGASANVVRLEALCFRAVLASVRPSVRPSRTLLTQCLQSIGHIFAKLLALVHFWSRMNASWWGPTCWKMHFSPCSHDY